MKKRILSVVIAFGIVFSCAMPVFAAEQKQRFWDVPNTHWAFDIISDLTERGVISGYTDGSFKPEATVSRSEWAKMMCVAGNLQINDNNVYFRDTNGHWANAYINAAKNYITAYSDSSFRPDQAIVREDVTRALVALKGYDISDVDYSHIMQFKDFDSISNQMKAYVAVAVEKELITGFDDDTFRGQSILTRAEAATLLYRAFQKGDAGKVADVPGQVYKEPVADSTSAPAVKPTPAPVETYEEEKPGKVVFKPENKEPDKEDNSASDNSDDSESEEEIDRTQVYVIDEFILNARDEISTDGKEYVYYIKNNDIYAHNVKTLKTKKLVDADDLDIDSDRAFKSDWETLSVCYDPSTEGIVIQGQYKTVNSASDKDAHYIYSIVDGQVETLFGGDDIPQGFNYISAIMDNGDFVDENVIWDRETLENKGRYIQYVENESGLALWGIGFDVVPDGKKLNFVGVYERDPGTSWAQQKIYVAQYANKTTDNLWELEGNAYAISNEYVAAASNGTIRVYNLLGKKIAEFELPEGRSYIATRMVIVDNFIIINDGEAKELIQIEI